MTRITLLTLASQYVYSTADALALAQRLTTAADVEAAVAHYSKRAATQSARTEMCFRGFQLGTVVLVVAAALLVAPGFAGYGHDADPSWCARAVAAALAGMLGAAVFGLHAGESRHRAKEQLKLLAPVVKSPSCKSALEFIEAGEPEVLAWRDLAVADRSVMCAFDVFIMRDIHYALLAARDAARIQSAQEAAGRALCGIAAPAPAGA